MGIRVISALFALYLVLIAACREQTSEPVPSPASSPPPTPSPTASVTPSPPPQVTEPSFAYARPDGTIWLASADGTGERPLILEPLGGGIQAAFNAAHNVEWSPDGEKLAYVEPAEPTVVPPSGSLWVLDISTRERRRIDDAVPFFRWLPGGRYIWYQFQSETWIADTAGDTKWKLLDRGGGPAWSRDGTRVAYTGPESSPGNDSNTRGFPLFVANVDGSNPRHLAESASLGSGFDSWSPDDRFLAYWKNEHGGSAVVGDICLLDITTGAETCLGEFTSDERPQWAPDRSRDIFHNLVIDPEGGTALELFERPGAILAWSPDASKVAYVQGNPFLEGPRSLVVLDPVSGQRTVFHTSQARIAHAGSPGYYGGWSPDGRYYAFVATESEEAGGSILNVANTVSGSANRVLAGFNFGEVFVSYSPDGSRLLIQNGTFGSPSVWIANPDGASASKLVDGVAISTACWRPMPK